MTDQAGTDPAPAIATEDLTVRYDDVLALDRVSLRVGAGRVTGLIGVNGAGKSTLFKALMGLVAPDSGTVRLAGEDPARARRAGLLSYVPQSEGVDATFPISVGEVVALGRYGRLGPTRRLRPVDRTAVADALHRVGLSELADRPIGRLSGGQRKRVFVARGLAQGAEILLLDEPFAGVDTASETTIVSLLRGLAGEGHTLLVSTHDLHTLDRLADDAVLLRRRVLFHGPVADALHPPRLAQAFGLDAPGSAA